MGVCSAKQKDPTQPGAPVPQPKHTPEKHAVEDVEGTPAKIHLPSDSSAPEKQTAHSGSVPGSPQSLNNDLLADLRNQPTLEAAEALERKRQEDAAQLERMRQEAEQARLKAEAEERAMAEERRRQEEIRQQKLKEEEAERARRAAEEAARIEQEALAEAKRKQEAERARALAFVEEARAAKAREEAERLAEEQRKREEAAQQEALARAEAQRIEEEARQRALEEEENQRRLAEEARQAEEARVAQEIAGKQAREEAEEAERKAEEDRAIEATTQRKAEVKSRVEELIERTGIRNMTGVSHPALFHCELLWLEDFTGEKFKPELSNLKSGEVLCKAVNQVQPNSAPYKEAAGPWKVRENILAFANGCEAIGLKKNAVFQPQDLEGQNWNAVVKTLDALYKAVTKRDGFKGPYMANPEDADDNAKRPSYSQPVEKRTPTGKKQEFGMHQEMRQKQNQKLEKEAANIEKVSDWLKKLSGMEFKDFQEGLRSGEVLCKAMNKIQKHKIKKIHSDEKPFNQRENITNFINACRDLGMKEQELFLPNDLYEGKNLLAVAESLISLNRVLKSGKVGEFRGPYIPELGGGSIHTRVVSFYAPGQSANPSSMGEHPI